MTDATGSVKRVLYIAYFFPPHGGAGVQRTLKFARYLPEFGWEPTVLTGPAGYWLQDETLAREASGIQVVRAPHWGSRFLGGGGKSTRRSARKTRWLRSVARSLLVPDAYIGWVIPARRVLDDMMRETKFDAVITTSSPDSAHLLGRGLRRKGLPWLADFRDPWTRRMSYAPPTGAHHKLHRHLETRVLTEADRIVVTSEATKVDFQRLVPQVSADRLRVITNGFDESDFADVPASANHRADCPVLHAGQLNPERPLNAYLQGLRLFLERNPNGLPQARTLFMGGHYDEHAQAVADFGLADVIRFEASCPHSESVAALLGARVLLLLEQNSDRGSLILPGKVFEYLRSGRPILAVVPPDGAAAEQIRALDAGWVADPEKPETVAEGLERVLADDATGATRESIDGYERRSLTGRLAAELDAILP